MFLCQFCCIEVLLLFLLIPVLLLKKEKEEKIILPFISIARSVWLGMAKENFIRGYM